MLNQLLKTNLLILMLKLNMKILLNERKPLKIQKIHIGMKILLCHNFDKNINFFKK